MWGNETALRGAIRTRRTLCAMLRAKGETWREIAQALGYRGPQHARIDWLRGQATAESEAA